MQYKPKNTNSQSDQSLDIETLLRYKRKGIRLTPQQFEALRLSGVYGETDIEKQDRAIKAAIQAMNTHDGTMATKNGYYTELFYYFCDCAVSNRQMVAPDPIPEKWQVMGQYRIDSGKKGSIKQVIA